VLSQVSREINVEALPLEMPEHLDLDVSAMQIGDTLRLSDLRVPEGVNLLDDLEETVLATLTLPTRIVEPEVEEEEEGEVPEGEEAPEGAAEAPAEGEGEAAAEPATSEE
jgi:large subunit ribosomal protein L25